MSTTEIEQPLISVPEALTPPEIGQHGDALRALYTLSDETTAELRPKLWDVAEKVASQVIDPAQQRAVAMYAAAADWHIFGKPGDPMPEGLVIAVAEDGTQDVMMDARIPWLNFSIHHVNSAMDRIGLRCLVDQAFDEIVERRDQIKGVIKDAIRNSAEYQLIESFDQPLSKPDSSLLTPFWRRIREGQIEQDVKRRYGLAPIDHIPVGTEAARDYSMQTYQLDDETMTQPQSPSSQHEAVLRARSYLTKYVKQTYEKREKKDFAEVFYEEGNGLSIRGVGDEDDDCQEFYDFASSAAEFLSDEVYIGPDELKEFSEMFLDYAILRIMDPRTGGNLKELLESVMEETANHFLYNLKDAVVPDYQGFGSGYAPRHLTTFLRGANGEHLRSRLLSEERELQNGRQFNWEQFFRGQSYIGTYSELRRKEQARLGRIDSYGPQNFRVGGRLLLESSNELELPKEVAHEDLVLAFDGVFASNDLTPMVPGYQLVSKRGFGFNYRYGFEVSPEGDPYRECTVIINEKRRASLAETYTEVGLNDLAAKVLGASRLTVAQLTKMIKEEAIYFLPDITEVGWDVRSSGDGPINRRLSYKDSLKDFGSSVSDGKLYIQCTGAAHFLRYSLEQAFGEGCAGFAAGYVIRDSSSVVNMAQHAQTVFTHKGKQYLLDATPAADLGNNRVPLDEAAGRQHRQTAAKAPQLEQAGHNNADISEVLIYNREKPLDEDVADQIQSLTKRLIVAFDVPNEEHLYKELVKLPKHDPARATYELLVQFGKGKLTDEEAFATIRYIENCANATPDARRKIGIGHYSNELIQQLESNAWHLKWAIERDRKPQELELAT